MRQEIRVWQSSWATGYDLSIMEIQQTQPSPSPGTTVLSSILLRKQAHRHRSDSQTEDRNIQKPATIKLQASSVVCSLSIEQTSLSTFNSSTLYTFLFLPLLLLINVKPHYLLHLCLPILCSE